MNEWQAEAAAHTWRDLPRGSSKLNIGAYALEVWKIGGEGWRWTVLHLPSGHYVGGRSGMESKDAAQHEALLVADHDAKERDDDPEN